MSILDRGTTFWFTVPCGRPSPESEVVFGPKEKTLSKTLGIVIHSKDLEDEENKMASEFAKIHIEGTVVLLVEDNWAHQVVMGKRLESMGCEVVKALNGRDAISILKKKDTHVDLIFMDIQMPLLVSQNPVLFILRHMIADIINRTDSRQRSSSGRTQKWYGGRTFPLLE